MRFYYFTTPKIKADLSLYFHTFQLLFFLNFIRNFHGSNIIWHDPKMPIQ